MRIILLIFFFVLPISCICFAQSNTSETLTITTYYPAPYGVYRNLRLNPSDKPVGVGVDRGVMYFNQSENATYVYMNNTLGWQPISGIWTKSGNNISTHNTGSVNITGSLIASGGITVGNSASIVPGTIRYTAANGFEGYHGGTWQPLGGGGVPKGTIGSGGSWRENGCYSGPGPCVKSCGGFSSPGVCNAASPGPGCESGWAPAVDGCQGTWVGPLVTDWDLNRSTCTWKCVKQ